MKHIVLVLASLALNLWSYEVASYEPNYEAVIDIPIKIDGDRVGECLDQKINLKELAKVVTDELEDGIDGFSTGIGGARLGHKRSAIIIRIITPMDDNCFDD